MKYKITVWVEGPADQKFISDVIQSWFNVVSNYDQNDREYNIELDEKQIGIRSLSGVDNFLEIRNDGAFKALFEMRAKNGRNVVILDADNNPDGRKIVAKEVEQKLGKSTPVFLIPDDRRIGNLESLLEEIINPKHQLLFECWEKYKLCLSEHPESKLTLPQQKAKIYAYLEALLPPNKKEQIQEGKRNYQNPEHWILNPEEKPILKALKTFLTTHLEIE